MPLDCKARWRPSSTRAGLGSILADSSQQTHILELLKCPLCVSHASLLEVATPTALAGAAQMNVIEFHTWNSSTKSIAKPDRMIFDLDPGEGTTWEHIQEATTLVRSMLDALGLAAWLKTSGGKGLHVVVPLTRRYDYDTVTLPTPEQILAPYKRQRATLPPFACRLRIIPFM